MSTAGEDLSHQSSYVFTPSSHTDESVRPSKRRKLSEGKPPAEKSNSVSLFTPLLNGNESPECVQRRQDTFKKLWTETDERIQVIIAEANENTLSKVTDFVKGEQIVEDDEMIPTGLIVTGPNISSQALLFAQLAKRLSDEIHGPVVTFRSGDASNLKIVLKKLNRDATDQRDGFDDEEVDLPSKQDGRKLLNYDLQILQDYVDLHKSEKVVVAFQDTEAFDSSLLAELILLFSSWRDRIPFVLLFGIATSVELFHGRLSRVATRCISGSQFDVEQSHTTLEKVFQEAIASPSAKLRLGPSLVNMLMERQHDHLQSVQDFIVAVKYAYMCHFYSHPLSILIDDTPMDRSLLQPEHFESIRSLPSFRNKVDEMVENCEVSDARALLQDDDALFEEVLKTLDLTKGLLHLLFRSIYVLRHASPVALSPTDLYTLAFSGTLRESPTVTNLISSIKRMSLASIASLTTALIQSLQKETYPSFTYPNHAIKTQNLIKNLESIKSSAAALELQSKGSGKQLRSKYSMQKTLRTTVIAQKVQLSTESRTTTPLDNAFSALIDRVIDIVEDLPFDNPKDMFLHEIWLYDYKNSHREVFTPKPRFAIERALSLPHQYLNCECCDVTEEGLASTQPATAILYQLYLESGSLVNVFDLWEAFHTILGADPDSGDVDGQDRGYGDNDEGEEKNERRILVLFYRALADLKAMGMVKGSKKKTDHLAKLAWRGL